MNMINRSSIIKNSNTGARRKLRRNELIQLGGPILGENQGGWSGENVAISGDGSTIVIGAKHSDVGLGSGLDPGQVKVYFYANEEWTQLGQDINGEAYFDLSGNSVAISKEGNVIAIGAIFNDADEDHLNSGHVRLYQYDDDTDTWVQMGDDINGEAGGDQFGFSVALSDDGKVLAGGSIKNMDGGINAGHVRVFRFVDGSWIQLGQNIEGSPGDECGYSVSLSRDGMRLAVGAPSNNGSGEESGQVRIFDYDSTSFTWDVQASLNGNNAGDFFGSYVSISNSGNDLIAAAIIQNKLYQGPGYVQAFHLSGKSWIAGGKIDGGVSDNSSIFSVASSGDCNTIAMSSSSFEARTDISKVYHLNDRKWDETGEIILFSEGLRPVGDFGKADYGLSVALSQDGSTIALGEPFIDKGNGRVTVYLLLSKSMSGWTIFLFLLLSLILAGMIFCGVRKGRRKFTALRTNDGDQQPFPNSGKFFPVRFNTEREIEIV